MAKYDVMKEQNEIEVKRAQVVYLRKVLNMPYEKITEITGYAISTAKAYVQKFSNLLEKAKEWFEDKIVKPIKETVGCANTFYLLRFYKNGSLVFSKIGTTTRSMNKRIYEHMRYYKDMVDNCVIDRVYDCKDIPCEGVESYFRAMYIKKFGKAFCKNDRFFGVEFDLNEADRMFASFMA